MGRVIRTVFKEIQVKRDHVSIEERTRMYTNLSRMQTCHEIDEEVYSHVIYYDWVFRGYNDNSAVFSKLSGIQRNGTEYVLKLIIHKDLSLFQISGHEGSCLDSRELEFQKGDLPSMALVLQYINTFHLCTGFEEDQHANAVIKADADNDKCIRQTTRYGNGPELVKVISRSCRLLVEREGSKCSSCFKLQHRQIKRRKTFYNLCATSKVPNKHLNRDELEKKLGSERNAIKNAKSREKYWKNKCSNFENECLWMKRTTKILEQCYRMLTVARCLKR